MVKLTFCQQVSVIDFKCFQLQQGNVLHVFGIYSFLSDLKYNFNDNMVTLYVLGTPKFPFFISVMIIICHVYL